MPQPVTMSIRRLLALPSDLPIIDDAETAFCMRGTPDGFIRFFGLVIPPKGSTFQVDAIGLKGSVVDVQKGRATGTGSQIDKRINIVWFTPIGSVNYGATSTTLTELFALHTYESSGRVPLTMDLTNLTALSPGERSLAYEETRFVIGPEMREVGRLKDMLILPKDVIVTSPELGIAGKTLQTYTERGERPRTLRFAIHLDVIG